MNSLERKIGQMLLLGFRGTGLSEEDAIVRDIRELHPGGVILFDYDVALGSPIRNIQSPEQVRALTSALQRFSETPLLIAVDQEGGQVARLKEAHGFPPTRSARELGAIDDPAATRREACRSAEAMAEAGINLNFAPCVDLGTGDANPIIGAKERSYGNDASRVVRHAREFVQAHQEQGVACAIKHFPGHGSSVADTHLGFVDVTERWTEGELEPFSTLIEEGDCWGVMTAHVFNAKLDPELPATLSRRVIEEVLRRRFCFQGVVFSDDMEMGAISSRYGLEESLFRAIEAGVDVLVFANNALYRPDVGRRAVATIKRLVEDGKIAEGRIDESYRRIAALKENIRTVGRR